MRAHCFRLLLAGLLLVTARVTMRAEAMLELFNVTWSKLTQKMPEIAEAGYDSLWVPNPAKGVSGGYSIGYDQFDPFDLGDKNQQGTIATKYGTKAELIQMVETAHRFGIRVYFDNVMNHRGATVPGYNSSTPTNFYPALIPQDFHLQTTSGGYRNWNNIDNYCDQWTVQNRPLLGLADLAQEPGSINNNFGPTLGSVAAKPVFIRQPGNPEYYTDPTTPLVGGGLHGFNGTNGQPVAEDVNAYLIRAAMWTLYATKCDGFRLDAVKHVPSSFFGANTGGSAFTDDPSFAGYTGGIQAMYDWVHGYGSNVTANGYLETDGNRNSLFDTEAPRNDAMLFGEHVSPVPDFQQYLNVGMRLCNQPLYNEMNNVLSGNDGFDNNGGMDGRDYTPPPNYCNGTAYPCYSPAQSVMFPQTQDGGSCCPVHQELQDAYYFMHEGLPMIYSDGYNHSGPPDYFPIVSYANYLGEFGDTRMPEIAYLHNQLSRGGTRSRWHDHNIVAWERYDYRDVSNGNAYTNVDATVVLFAMNDNFNNPGDVEFDDGVSRTSDGYYGCANGSPSRGCGLCVSFPPGSVLSQMATSSTSSNRACAKLLVHGATTSLAQAQATANDPNPVNRLIYVNTTPPPGGGAIELLLPSGGWVMYAYQWPEPSRANVLTNAITFRQAGAPVATFKAYRHDGVNGDTNFNPVYPFKMRGSVDPSGNVLTGQNVSNLSYSIDIPVLTNAPFDIAVRSDASAANVLAKLDGGMDLNSQMGLGTLTGLDRRDNRPGYVSDVFLGYEQAIQQLRYSPEKFAAMLDTRNNVTSLGAETYYYNVGSTNTVVLGSGNGANINTYAPSWVYHAPSAPATVLGGGPATQMNPTNPASGQSVDIWVKVGYNYQTNQCFIYYTTDGSNPEGAYGVGKGTTQVVPGSWVNHDSSDNTIDWFKGTIPGQTVGKQVRYKIALFQQNIPTISDADNSKLYGLTQFGITNFDPTSVTVWKHNDLNTNNTQTGLSSGFHILRARCFLPRSGKSGVYNTFSQTFYYDGTLPDGVIAVPAGNGATLTNSIYQVVLRTDSSVTGIDFNIQDSDPNNDDTVTRQANGNGNSNGVPVFAGASSVTPNSSLSQQYPSFPNEFRFNYVAVPTSGSATITVHLKTFATSVYPNRFTTLSASVNTLAPPNTLYFSNPVADGTPLLVNSNTQYLLQACFTPTLDTNVTSMFSLYINGVLQPTNNYILRSPGAVAGCPGLRSLLYFWNSPPTGPAVLQLNFTNAGVSLTATRTVPVAVIGSPVDSDGDGMPDWMELLAGTNPYDPSSVFRITDLGFGNPVELAWSSVSNKVYQVLSTTNLAVPMAVDQNGGSVPANTAGNSTQWFDPASNGTNKFYRIELLQ